MSEASRDRPSRDGESPNAIGSADWTGEQAGGLAAGQAKRDHRNPISIAMMFYILTLAGIIAACVGRIAQQEAVSKNYAMASIAGGCFLGLLIGFWVAPSTTSPSRRRSWEALWGLRLGLLREPLR